MVSLSISPCHQQLLYRPSINAWLLYSTILSQHHITSHPREVRWTLSAGNFFFDVCVLAWCGSYALLSLISLPLLPIRRKTSTINTYYVKDFSHHGLHQLMLCSLKWLTDINIMLQYIEKRTWNRTPAHAIGHTDTCPKETDVNDDSTTKNELAIPSYSTYSSIPPPHSSSACDHSMASTHWSDFSAMHHRIDSSVLLTTDVIHHLLSHSYKIGTVNCHRNDHNFQHFC